MVKQTNIVLNENWNNPENINRKKHKAVARHMMIKFILNSINDDRTFSIKEKYKTKELMSL